MADSNCSTCNLPLFLEVYDDSDSEGSTPCSPGPEKIPDDVQLPCGCHFHWECLLGSYTVTECSNCGKNVASFSPNGQQHVLCTVKNESGVEIDYDILPAATEESYLRTFPDERQGYAFLQFAKEGDLDAMVCLIRDGAQDDAEESQDKIDVLRYCGTFEGVEGSALHVAIRYNQPEAAWLLLVLGSSLPWTEFPGYVSSAMEGFGLSQNDRIPGPDVRSLKDSDGKTPAMLAEDLGGVWTEWNKSGRLSCS